MDSITQAALGAVVGEAVLGRRVGNKALGWGALAGTLPDLDVVVAPFVSEATFLIAHRGPTHALAFAPVVAPLLGWLVWRLYRRRGSPAAEAGWSGWAWLFFWALLTHPLLDLFTVYGTQLFWPFSHYPAAIPALFIVDPLYTLPLLAAAVACWRTAREAPARRRWAWAGLGLSSLYLVWALGVKAHVETVVRGALAEQGIAARRVLTTPTPLNTLLWSAVADTGDSLHVGLYGLLDPDRAVAFRGFAREAGRLDPYRGTRAVETVEWFSRGYSLVREDPTFDPADETRPTGVVLYDVRFGRADAWLGPDEEAGYVFAFHFVRRPDGGLTFRQPSPSFQRGGLGALARRVGGDRSVEGGGREGEGRGRRLDPPPEQR